MGMMIYQTTSDSIFDLKTWLWFIIGGLTSAPELRVLGRGTNNGCGNVNVNVLHKIWGVPTTFSYAYFR